jgi:predicted TPR repeat methyltransferase
MPDPSLLLRQALSLHQQGRLGEAERAYLAVLALLPGSFDATHLLGVIARQRGQFEAAAEWIGKAIAIDAGHAIAHCNLGTALQALGQSAAALASYDRALALKPDYAMALYNRGNALRSLARPEQALASYEKALELQPAYAEAWCARGMLLQTAGRVDEALASVGRALAIKPGYSDAALARGLALHSLHRYDEAIACYDGLLAAGPARADACFNRGNALQRLQRHEEALASHERALALEPDHAGAHRQRGHALRALGRTDEAIPAYRQALGLGGDNGEIAYALAALGAAPVPAAAPAAYVRELFDQYAGHFDEHLVEVLAYDMPGRLAAAIGALRPADGSADIIDLGCGTGLCGPCLSPYAATLTGVDLSQNMLARAARHGLYDRLVCAELVGFLSDRREHGTADVAVAADVFVYIGDLSAVFAALRLALRPGGLLVFSVEAMEEGEDGDGRADDCRDDRAEDRSYRLLPSNRYAHTAAYLRRLAGRHGLTVMAIDTCAGRRENGVAIPAYAVTMRIPD